MVNDLKVKATVSWRSATKMGNQFAANMSKQVRLVIMEGCLVGKMTATARSTVRGSSASIPHLARTSSKMVYTSQCSVAIPFGAPTNLLSTIPSPLKKPMVDTRISLTATLMMKRLLHRASLILWRVRARITVLEKRTPSSPITESIEP